MKIELNVIKGHETGKIFSFQKHDIFTIGREKDVQFQLPHDPYVSRHHLIIEINPPRCYLRDLGSTNGTKVNGRKVKEIALKDGDRIKIGKTVLAVGFKRVIKKKESKVRCIICNQDANSEAAIDKGTFDGEILYICKSCREKKKIAPEIVPGYEKISVIGRGGMGIVYKARKSSTGEIVAIKMILPEYALNEKSRKLFLREMKVASKLIHPNIVMLYDHGEHYGQFWFTMEFIEGTDAQKMLMQKGPMAFDLAGKITAQILNGLDYAHKKGFVHRDIKPPNILLSGDGDNVIAKLSDFGLAKNYRSAGGSDITRYGEIKGSLPFMPPEQILNCKYVKQPCDIYAIGATLYFMVTGQSVYNFSRKKDPFLMIIKDKPVPVLDRNKNIPKKFAEVIDNAISKNPNERFSSAKEMKKAIEKAIK
jgi:serine/threonine-protein kinase